MSHDVMQFHRNKTRFISFLLTFGYDLPLFLYRSNVKLETLEVTFLHFQIPETVWVCQNLLFVPHAIAKVGRAGAELPLQLEVSPPPSPFPHSMHGNHIDYCVEQARLVTRDSGGETINFRKPNEQCHRP